MTIKEIKEILSKEGFRPTVSDSDELSIKVGGKLYYIAMMPSRNDYLTVFTYRSFRGTAVLSDYWAIQEGINVMEKIIVGKCLPVGRDKDQDLSFRVSVETFAEPESLKRYFFEYLNILHALMDTLSQDIAEEKKKRKKQDSGELVQ